MEVCSAGRTISRAHAFDRHVATAKLVARQEDLAGRTFAKAAEHAVLADLLRQSMGAGDIGTHECARVLLW